MVCVARAQPGSQASETAYGQLLSEGLPLPCQASGQHLIRVNLRSEGALKKTSPLIKLQIRETNYKSR